MIAAMKDTTKLNGKTFADYMNNISTQLASDSVSNQTCIKDGHNCFKQYPGLQNLFPVSAWMKKQPI